MHLLIKQITSLSSVWHVYKFVIKPALSYRAN